MRISEMRILIEAAISKIHLERFKCMDEGSSSVREQKGSRAGGARFGEGLVARVAVRLGGLRPEHPGHRVDLTASCAASSPIHRIRDSRGFFFCVFPHMYKLCIE